MRSNTGCVTGQYNTFLVIQFPFSPLASLISNFRYFTFSPFLLFLTKPFTHHLCKGSPPQNQLLSCHGQQTRLPAHCWAEGTSPRAAQGLVLSSLKRLKPEIFRQDGRAGQEGSSQSVLLYHQEKNIRSLHIVHGLTLSTTQIFIHLDPSGSSRWLGNACLSLPLSKLHCIMAPGKCNGHYERRDSSLLLLHPAPFLLEAGPC